MRHRQVGAAGSGLHAAYCSRRAVNRLPHANDVLREVHVTDTKPKSLTDPQPEHSRYRKDCAERLGCGCNHSLEVGLESIATTLADGIVGESELNNTIPKLDAVVQECASVKYLLEALRKGKKRKVKR